MKRSDLTWKDVLALLIGLLALAGLGVMLTAEANIVPGLYPYYEQVLPGLQKYSLAFGLILLAAGVAYLLLGQEDNIVTSPDEEK